jgi:hypothetical protein
MKYSLRSLMIDPWHPYTLAGVVVAIILSFLLLLVAGIIHGL